MLALGRGHFTVSSVLSGPHSQCHCSSYRGGQHREAMCVSAWVPLESCMHLLQGPPLQCTPECDSESHVMVAVLTGWYSVLWGPLYSGCPISYLPLF